jgi:signal transduction histidine kinase
VSSRLTRRIALAYVALVVAVTTALGAYLAWSLRSGQMQRLLAYTANEARLAADAAGPALAAEDGAAVQALALRVSGITGDRVTLIDTHGVVLGDSETDPATLENHASRPEVAPVLAGAAEGTSVRHSASVGRDLVYVAVPVLVDGRLVGVSRLSRDVGAVDAEVSGAARSTVIAVAAAGLLAALLAVRIARQIGRPIVQLTETARAMAAGNLTWRVGHLRGPDEVGELARAFDEMAARLRMVVTQLESDRARLERAEAARRDFVANISHELKTPIASIKALTETLEEGALDDPPAARDFLQRMHVEVDDLAQLVKELLELSQIESGRTPMSLAPRAPAELVQAAVERLAPQVERAGLALAVHAPAGLPPVWADEARIQGAILNLLHNAIKFTPPGGRIDVRATLERAQGGERVRFSVRDTGVGVSADELPRLFERFWKADRSRASSGTGLGLAIVKHVVQAHGGEVGVESQLGVGSTFWFTLPLASEPVPA